LRKVAHGADVALHPLQPVGVGLAILGALPVHPIPLDQELAVEACEHGVIA
jgi:hypothetical protein